MPTAYANIDSKTENACAAYLATIAGIVATIYTGENDQDKVIPCVIVNASAGDEDIEGTGNFWVDVTITTLTNGPIDVDGLSQKPADDLLVGLVMNALLITDGAQTSILPAALNAVGVDFTCQCVRKFNVDSDTTGDAWRNTLKFQAYCCGSTLTP